MTASVKAIPLSSFEAIALDFCKEFKASADGLRKSTQSQPVNVSYFTGKNGTGGFLHDLCMCLSEQGFGKILEHGKPELNEDRSVPLFNFAKGICLLREEKLKQLKSFHTKMEAHRGDGKGIFPPEYRRISHYFDNADNSTDDSGVAGRTVMLMSDMSEFILDMKECIKKYVPLTVAEYQKVLAEAAQRANDQVMESVDHIRKAIDLLLKHITFPELPLTELHKLRQVLGQQKKKFIQLVIVKAGQLKNIAQDKISQIKRNLMAWKDWEILNGEQNNNGNGTEGEGFRRYYKEFETELTKSVGTYDSISENIEKCLKKKEHVSSYFLYMLSDVATIIKHVLSLKIRIEPAMRVQLQKTLYTIQNTLRLHERHLTIANKEAESFPADLQRKLDFLNESICATLARSNPKEIKYMTIAYDASYKLIGKYVADAMIKARRSAEIEKYTNIYKKRFADIIRSSVKIVKSQC